MNVVKNKSAKLIISAGLEKFVLRTCITDSFSLLLFHN